MAEITAEIINRSAVFVAFLKGSARSGLALAYKAFFFPESPASIPLPTFFSDAPISGKSWGLTNASKTNSPTSAICWSVSTLFHAGITVPTRPLLIPLNKRTLFKMRREFSLVKFLGLGILKLARGPLPSPVTP